MRSKTDRLAKLTTNRMIQYRAVGFIQVTDWKFQLVRCDGSLHSLTLIYFDWPTHGWKNDINNNNNNKRHRQQEQQTARRSPTTEETYGRSVRGVIGGGDRHRCADPSFGVVVRHESSDLL